MALGAGLGGGAETPAGAWGIGSDVDLWAPKGSTDTADDRGEEMAESGSGPLGTTASCNSTPSNPSPRAPAPTSRAGLLTLNQRDRTSNSGRLQRTTSSPVLWWFDAPAHRKLS